MMSSAKSDVGAIAAAERNCARRWRIFVRRQERSAFVVDRAGSSVAASGDDVQDHHAIEALALDRSNEP